MKKNFLWILLCVVSWVTNAQSVQQLRSNYSGQTAWDNTTKTLTFVSSGTIRFNAKGCDKKHFWDVPKEVKTIIVNNNTRVLGAFHTYADCVIKGKNRKTSVIYGTDNQEWADKNNPCNRDLDEWYYSQFDNQGGTLTVENLTSLNPFSYHIRSWERKAIVRNCDIIDDRGGFHNHSDGFAGGDGSLVENCYFSTADDVFKAYFSYTARNCEINMIRNAVPIQCGWGSNYSQNKTTRFENIKITGNDGRGASGNPIISGRQGNWTKSILIDGLEVANDNASLVSFVNGTGDVDITISNAKIKVATYQRYFNNNQRGTVKICGQAVSKNTNQKIWNCFDDNNGEECQDPQDVMVSKRDVSCDTEGSITLSPKNYDGRTGIRYKLNNGSYTDTKPTNSSYTFNNLKAGTYSVYAQWGNGDCADTKLENITINDNCENSSCPDTQQANISSSDENCNAKGSITITPKNYGGRTGIRYKLNYGSYTDTKPTNSSYTFNNLEAGTYSVYAQWGNGDCADTKLEDITITNDCENSSCLDTQQVNISSSDENCNAKGSITITPKNYGGRTGIRYKLNNSSYTDTKPTNSSYTFNNLQAGTYTVYAQWGNGDCTDTKLETVSILKDCNVSNNKPNMWILTDFTGATGYTSSNNTPIKANTAGDPDDLVAMAMYLMNADKFNTVKIVLNATTKKDPVDVVNYFNNTFRKAYEIDVKCWKSNGLDYPDANTLSVVKASTYNKRFNPNESYANYAALPETVKALVDELGKTKYTTENPLFVNVWGPMTEVAIATKHLINNNRSQHLNRMFVVSHWTSTKVNQAPQGQNNCYSNTVDRNTFGVANCNEDCNACKYMHDQAKRTDAKFRFVDCGSSGQAGIVSGSGSSFNGGYQGNIYNQFTKSQLGKLFVKSKFAYGKPDGSDAATFYTILGSYGVALKDYNDNGMLTYSNEDNAIKKFKSAASSIITDLLTLSNKASGNCQNKKEEINANKLVENVVVYPTMVSDKLTIKGEVQNKTISIVNIAGVSFDRKKAMQNQIAFDTSGYPSGMYWVVLEINGKTKSFSFIKQ